MNATLSDDRLSITLQPDGKSPVLRREFSISVTSATAWQDKITYNSGTYDSIGGSGGSGMFDFFFGKYRGGIRVNNQFLKFRIDGTLEGDDGVFDFTLSSSTGAIWEMNYWWDLYKTKDIGPDEGGNLNYFFLGDGTGSVTLYDKNGLSASTTYKLDFLHQLIR